MHKSKWKLPTAQPRAPRIPDPLPHARPWAADLPVVPTPATRCAPSMLIAAAPCAAGAGGTGSRRPARGGVPGTPCGVPRRPTRCRSPDPRPCPRQRPEGTARRRTRGARGCRCLPRSVPASLPRRPRAAARPRAARGRRRRLMLGAPARGSRPPAAAPALRQLRAERLPPQPAPRSTSAGSGRRESAGSEREGAGRAAEGCGAKVPRERAGQAFSENGYGSQQPQR